MIRSHWGSYVLFQLMPQTSRVVVLRGPMSSLPCFCTEIRGVTLFFSRPADLADVVPLTFNWDYICSQSVKGDYLCRETGLRGVSTLLPGECICVQPEGSAHRSYWTPSSAAECAAPRDFDDAARLLGATTRAVINSWCSSHESILVSLSGGFDSSVVLSCAVAAPTRPVVCAVTFYSRNSADERPYARSAAQKAGVSLEEIELPDDVDLSMLLDCSKTASPVLNFTAFAMEPAFRQLSEHHNSSAVLTGELGDCVLGHGFGPELLGEALWRYKLSSRLLQILLDYSLLYRTSIWRAAKLSMDEYRLHRRAGSLGLYQRYQARGMAPASRLASVEAISRYEENRFRFVHPWFRNVNDGPPGWLQTVATMVMLTSTSCQAPFSGAIDSLFVSPLASQPLVEAFLAIPADFHICDSQNAAVARQAFASQLSADVLARGTAKGTPELWLRDTITRNRRFLRELLLDGLLVKERILDRRKVDDALSGSLTHAKSSVVDIITQLYIESWLRRWAIDTGQNSGKVQALLS